MTDRELLELATKAAGNDAVYVADKGGFYTGVGSYSPARWNPLTDDGDALRLAVKLRIVIDPEGLFKMIATKYTGSIIDHIAKEHAATDHDADRGAAMRLAVVRVAAEIGKAMP